MTKERIAMESLNHSMASYTVIGVIGIKLYFITISRTILSKAVLTIEILKNVKVFLRILQHIHIRTLVMYKILFYDEIF